MLKFYPKEEIVMEAVGKKEPLILLIHFNGEEDIVARLEDSVEHHILLNQTGHKYDDLDNYFRVIVDDKSAEWTFVCPKNYKNIANETHRIKEFYKDGFAEISRVLAELEYFVPINIPVRYNRHLTKLKEEI